MEVFCTRPTESCIRDLGQVGVIDERRHPHAVVPAQAEDDPRAPDNTGIQVGRGGVHAAPPGSGRGDLVEPAGGAIVYEAPNLVLQGDERAGLDA